MVASRQVIVIHYDPSERCLIHCHLFESIYVRLIQIYPKNLSKAIQRAAAAMAAKRNMEYTKCV